MVGNLGRSVESYCKKMMLELHFQYVDLVKFHVGAENWRSRKAMEKLVPNSKEK